MSKPAKPAATGDQPPKSKKMLIIIIAVVVLLAGGAAAFLLMKPAHPPKQDQTSESEEATTDEHADEEEDGGSHEQVPPKFVEIGTFTANLIQEEGDRYLQVAISLKLSKPELEEKLKASNPEVLHRINMLLQSKRPSELSSVEGKEKLANDIKAQVEYVMGLRKTAPVIRATQPPTEGEEVKSEHAEAPEAHSKKGIAEVLFTSFIIQ